MAHEAKRNNVYSEFSLHEVEDTSAITHTHGRTVSLPVVRTKASKSSTDPKLEDVKWAGKVLNLGKLANTMDRASKDCIREGKKNIFPVFSEVPEDRTGKPIYRGQTLHRTDVDD